MVLRISTKTWDRDMSLLFYAVFFLFGLILPVFLPQLLPFQILIVLLASGLLFWRVVIARVVCILLFACLLSSTQLHRIINAQLPASLQGQDLKVRLHVLGLPQEKRGNRRFVARVIEMSSVDGERCEYCARMRGQKIKLSWRRDNAAQILRSGQTWRLRVRLKKPRGFVNPGGFDYQAWLLGQGFSASGYVKRHRDNQLLSRQLLSLPASLREGIDKRLFSVQNLELEGILRALILGDKAQISADQWKVLQATGTSHLMAISGLHIGLIAMFAFTGVRWMFALLPMGGSYLLLRAVPAFASIAASGIYAAVSGFAVPSQRAWFIVVVVSTCYLIGRKLNPWRLLLFAAIAVLLVNPLAATQNGFWLSFGAVFSLLLSFAYRARVIGAVKGVLLMQWSVFVGLSILLFACQLPLSGWSPLANIVAVPVVSLLVIPSLFLAALFSLISQSIAFFFFNMSHIVLQKVWDLLSWMSRVDLNVWFSIGNVWLLVVGFIGAVFILLPRALALKLPGLILLCLALCGNRGGQADNDYRMTVLDVGQGLSLVVETPNQTLVYDVGAKFSSGFDIGSRVVAPYLRYRNLRKVDVVAISHGDGDHVGGLQGLLTSLPTERLMINQSLNDRKNKRSELEYPLAEPCLAGMQWQMDALNARVLWPSEKSLGASHSNNDSCVILLQSAGVSLLLTGDIEAAVETKLLESGLLPATVDVLIAPHHGSKTSSSKAFIRALKPKHVVFSAGFLSPYRHPSLVVVERYREAGTQIWNTAEHGAVTLEWGANISLEVFSERWRSPKPWFD